MNRFLCTAITFGALSATALGLAGTAAADPLGGDSASDVVTRLQDRGYDVQVQGDTEAPLSECTASQISGLAGTNAAGQGGVSAGSTVYVTLSCDDDHDE